ncbi:hypothetical protein KOW79_001460 [Hemibagrus wyckioides]|uniref:Uncharacterized protein n=1 Tax=Hemibagrus wyckioides TaxID=337641 RepID=A0A9D3SX58_9TELE|nr:hypothetical protein KOW79_001460 [Hemibagrus wyckioides]
MMPEKTPLLASKMPRFFHEFPSALIPISAVAEAQQKKKKSDTVEEKILKKGVPERKSRTAHYCDTGTDKHTASTYGERVTERHTHSLTWLRNGYTPASPEENLMDFDLISKGKRKPYRVPVLPATNTALRLQQVL